MRWQGALGWFVATGICLYLAVGMTVVTIVTAVVSKEIVATALLLLLALFFGLLSWPLVRMGPRYSTQQGVSVDGNGITLTQNPKRWFPGRTAHISWSQIRSTSKEVRVVHQSKRNVYYYIDIELRDPLPDAPLPTWTERDGAKIRINTNEARQAQIARLLRTTRPDLFTES